jgi:hypothetical protein
MHHEAALVMVHLLYDPGHKTMSAAEPAYPKFFSFEFHARFFPRVLMDRLGRKKRGAQGATFTSTLEMMIALVVCVVLAVIGIPSALAQGSVVGWVLTIIGVGGIVALLIASVAGSSGYQPTYDDFLTGIFFFFIALGILAGIAVGMETHSAVLGLCASAGGLVAAYVLGIVAGLRMQHLGWIASILNMLAGLGAIILGGTIVIMLVVLTVK